MQHDLLPSAHCVRAEIQWEVVIILTLSRFARVNAFETILRVSQGFLGTREHWQNIEGNNGTLANFWEQGNRIRKITVRKNSDIINREHYFGVFIYGHLCTTVVPTLV